FLALLVFDRLIRSSKYKGRYGENEVIKILKRLPKEYIVLNDFLLQNGNKTSQIDHIVLCKKGIFVIETKNYGGYIYGSELDKNWTQIIGKRKIEFEFLNPIIQNKGHIDAIRHNLSLNNKIPIISVVVFSNNGNIANVNSHTPVKYISELKSFILKYDTIVSLSESEIQDINYGLVEKNIKGKKARKQHMKNIQRRYAS
uniref:nuclease-related domain-containing protein n=1 Tax=Clostridium beijerinckii TaxID=1520 RepID=UPI0022E53D58